MLSKYLDKCINILNEINAEKKLIYEAGKIVGDCYLTNGMVYVFGTCHSQLPGLDMFYRAGGLAKITPIIEPPLMLHTSASTATVLERKSGYAAEILSRYPVESQDVLIISSNSGKNAVPVEMAEYFLAKGAKVIAITSLEQSKSAISKAKSGKRLFEVSHVSIDNHSPVGDACIPLDNGQMVASTSTVIGAAIGNLIELATIEYLATKGNIPELFVSSNIDNGDAINSMLLAKYKPIIGNL